MARPTWKGFLKVSLVSIPIKVFPATSSSAAISFNQLHSVCQTRINQKRWCATCDREVPNDELVKGYEFDKGRWVVMTDEDLEKVTPESTKIINLAQFADASELDPIYLDRGYYLAPDGPLAAEAFAVMREGMRGKIGIGKVSMFGKEYLIAIAPREAGLVMYTLHHTDEIRSLKTIEELDQLPAKIKPEELKLARQVVENIEGKLDLAAFKDEYKAELLRVIEKKVKGEEIVVHAVAEPQKIVNIMEALRKSLDTVSAAKKKAAKADLAGKGKVQKQEEPKRRRRA